MHFERGAGAEGGGGISRGGGGRGLGLVQYMVVVSVEDVERWAVSGL